MRLEIEMALRQGAFTLEIALEIRNRVTALFGPSGSGKTTLLHLLGGLRRPDRGRMVLDGELLLDTARGICRPAHLRRIGMVFQDGRLFPHLRVRDNLEYGFRQLARVERQFEPDDIIRLMELEPLLERWPSQLSGGEGQRVALGRAILAAPRLLLLDEPMSSLDWRLRRQITPFLRRVKEATEIPIIYVSHDPGDLLDLTDQFAVMEQGRLLGHGALVDLVGEARILDVLEQDGVVSVLPLTVERHMDEQGVTGFALEQGGGRVGSIRGPLVDRAPGSLVHAVLRPDDITLALTRVEGISMQNQVSGRIVKLAATPTRDVCVVDIGVPLIVEITRAARLSLGLDVGSPVWCLFKACAIRYREV